MVGRGRLTLKTDVEVQYTNFTADCIQNICMLRSTILKHEIVFILVQKTYNEVIVIFKLAIDTIETVSTQAFDECSERSYRHAVNLQCILCPERGEEAKPHPSPSKYLCYVNYCLLWDIQRCLFWTTHIHSRDITAKLKKRRS